MVQVRLLFLLVFMELGFRGGVGWAGAGREAWGTPALALYWGTSVGVCEQNPQGRWKQRGMHSIIECIKLGP